MLSSLKSDPLTIAVRPGDWEPVGRREPLPRIETSPRKPAELPAVKTVGDMLADAHRAKEADRIWRAVREAAGGTVEPEPVVEVVSVELPGWPGLCPEDLVGVQNPGWMESEARTAYQHYCGQMAAQRVRQRKMQDLALARQLVPLAPASPAHASNGLQGYLDRAGKKAALGGLPSGLRTNDELLARLKASNASKMQGLVRGWP